MYVEVIGLGHIGLLSLVHLASKGLQVRPLDKDASKVANILEFRFDYLEGDLKELALKENVRVNILKERPGKRNKIYYLICVGTPTGPAGAADLSQVYEAIEQILASHPVGEEIRVLLRSTVPAGTCENIMAKYADLNFSLTYFPEFIRTGESLKDLISPSLFVYASDGKGADFLVKEFPEFENARKLSFKTCEHLKYLSNTWHALKVSFANEMGVLATKVGVNKDELFEAFLSDKKLNISEKYLKPGPPYGGPCLTKEVEALNYLARESGVSAPLLEQINNSNDVRIKEFEKSLRELKPSRIFVFGIGFRPNTADTRHSVTLKLLSNFESWDISIIDKNIKHERFKNIVALPSDLNATDLVLVASQLPDESSDSNIKKSGCKILDLGYHRIHTG